jgi:peptide/nickel transport system substrate-binding protein
MRKTSVSMAVTAALLGMALSACGSGGSSNSSSSGGKSGSAGGEGTLTIGVQVPPSGFAAANAQGWGYETYYYQAVYDTLLRQKPDGSIAPWLATSWSYDSGKTVLTMKLRTDVKFTDGTPFTAAIAAQNLLAYRDGTSNQKSYLAVLKSATAADPSTLVLTLSAPEPALLTYLATTAGLMEAPSGIASKSAQTVPVGSGPYILDSATSVVGSTYVFKKNPNYWAPQEQHYKSLVVKVFSTTPTEVAAIQGKQVNAISMLDNSAGAQIKAAGFEVYAPEQNWGGLTLFDRGGKITPALGNVKVRQAINYALDRPALLKAVALGLGTTTDQIFGKNTTGYDASFESTYPYDVAKAKQLMAEAGYAGGFTLQMPQFPLGSTALYDLTKQYLEAIGIKCVYQPEQLNGAAFADVLAPKFSAFYWTFTSTTPSWLIAQLLIGPKASFNPFHTTDPTVDGYLKTMQSGSDADAGTAAKALNKYVVDQAWFAPFYNQQVTFAADSQTNVVPQIDSMVPTLQNITPKG